MGGFRGFVWQLVATLGYCAMFVLVAAALELSTTASLIPAAVLLAYALSAQAFPRPWRYWLATGPWLLVLLWFAMLYVGGGLDCGSDCDGGVLEVLFAAFALGFASVIVAGPVVWLARRRGRSSR